MYSIEDLKGQDLIDFIETNRSGGKTLEQLATELGITKDALKGRYRRAKNKESKEDKKPVEDYVDFKPIQKHVSPASKNDVCDKLDTIIKLLQNGIVPPNSPKVVERIQNNAEQLVVPIFTGETSKSSLRINTALWNEFEGFCKANGQYKKQDLIALALKEFLEKYNK